MKVKEFVKETKKIHKEVKVILKKLQEEMKKYIDKNRKKAEEYKVEDKVLLDTKDLMQQIKNRKMKKLTKKFMRLYKIKKMILVELELLASIKIYLVVNMSRITLCQEQVEGQKQIVLRNSIEFSCVI